MHIPTSFAVLMALLSTWAQSLDLLLLSSALLVAISISVATAPGLRAPTKMRNTYMRSKRRRVVREFAG